MRYHREWIVLDGMGVACEACRRHGVIDANKIAICKRFAIARVWIEAPSLVLTTLLIFHKHMGILKTKSVVFANWYLYYFP